MGDTPSNPLADKSNRPIRMDKEGRWFYYNSEIINEKISLLFSQSLERDAEGDYVISLWGDRAYVELEDAPYVVVRAHRREADDAQPYFDVIINDGTCEKLDLKPLRINRENVLYCKVKGGGHTARFNRNSVYQLLKYLEYDESADQHYLESDGVRYPIG